MNRDIIRKLIEYFVKYVLLKAIFTLTVFKIFLFEGQLVFSPAQRGTGSGRVNSSDIIFKIDIIYNTLSLY